MFFLKMSLSPLKAISSLRFPGNCWPTVRSPEILLGLSFVDHYFVGNTKLKSMIGWLLQTYFHVIVGPFSTRFWETLGHTGQGWVQGWASFTRWWNWLERGVLSSRLALSHIKKMRPTSAVPLSVTLFHSKISQCYRRLVTANSSYAIRGVHT